MSGQFIIVSSQALEDKELLKSPAAFITLCTISTMTSQTKNGWCYFKQETLADRRGISRQAISQHLQKLKELGYIEIREQSYKGRQSNNLYRLIYDRPFEAVQGELAPVPQGELAPPAQGELAPKRYSYIKDKREREPLTRDDFLNDINVAFHAGKFSEEFGHLNETEIMLQGSECHRAWGDDLRGREPHVILRSWIRKGINLGMIPKAPKKASQRIMPELNSAELADWQTDAVNRKIFTEAEMIAWIAKLEYDGEKTLFAPSRFHAQQVEKRFIRQLQRAVHSQVQIKVKETVS